MIATGYSFRHAVGSLSDVISRIAEIGWTSAPICDRTSTFGHVKWAKMTREAGLRPIYGVSIGCVPSFSDSRPPVDWWKFYAVDSIELLHDALHEATRKSSYEPYLTYARAAELPGLVKVAGSRLLIDHLIDFDDSFHFAISPSTPRGLFLAAKKRGLRMVADCDNSWPRPEDEMMYHAVLGRRGQTRTYPRHVMADDELRLACSYADDESFAAAVVNREAMFDRCRAEPRRAVMVKPVRKKSLLKMCRDGAVSRGCDLSDPTYSSRLEKELATIEEKNFADYFYVVAEAMQWARKRMICGPGRGSSSGSLACWLLGITAVDPIKFDLVFERFIDVTRADLPDIDVDVSDEAREDLFEHFRELYGRDKVARLATVTMFASKSALNQVGKAIGVPKWMIDNAADSVVIRSGGDSRADYTIADTFELTSAGKKLVSEYPEMAIAGRIESHPVNPGQHAAGVVLTAGSIREVVGVSAHNNVAMVDWKDAKAVDLLKIDVLGLTQLSIFERCLKMVGLPASGEFLESIPLDDPAALDVLSKRHLSGIFQFQGATTRQVVHQLWKITGFEDIVAIAALCRPGPLGSGGTQSWINRKNGVEAQTVIHEAFRPYLANTLGVMVYQEQIMRICREIGSMSWEAVTTLRGAMGKSLGMEFFDRYRDQFIPGAVAKGVPEEAARKMWDGMCSFGMYAFNRAHSVSYAMITYWCCWLKAYHPAEFAAATLDAESDPVRQIEILRELKAEGIDYVAFDPEMSGDRWVVKSRGDRKVLIGPISNIKGVGGESVKKVLEARKSGAPLSPSLVKKLASLKTEISSLYPVSEAVARLWPNLRDAGIETRPTPVEDVYSTRAGRDVVVIGVLVKNHPLNENEPSRVARRGYAVKGPVEALNFRLQDDTGDVFCKVSRWQYAELGKKFLDAKAGSSLFAIKGDVPKDFRMVWVRRVKYLGEMTGRRGDDRDGTGHEPAGRGASRAADPGQGAGAEASQGS